MGWRIHTLVRQKISSKALDFLQLPVCGHRTHFSNFLRIINSLSSLTSLLCWKESGCCEHPLTATKKPKKYFPSPNSKKSLLPGLLPLMNPNKCHIKSHLSSMGLFHIFSPDLWRWWSFRSDELLPTKPRSWLMPDEASVTPDHDWEYTHVCSEGFGQQIIVLLAPQERTKAAFCSGISLLSRKPNSMLGVAERATVCRKWFDTSELQSSLTFHYSWGQ